MNRGTQSPGEPWSKIRRWTVYGVSQIHENTLSEAEKYPLIIPLFTTKRQLFSISSWENNEFWTVPSKIAASSRVVSRKALLPGRFNGSRTLLSPRENAKFLNFHYFSTTPEVPKALRRTSGSLPGTRSETRPDPESSLRINPSFSLGKTTPFRKAKWASWVQLTSPSPRPL